MVDFILPMRGKGKENIADDYCGTQVDRVSRYPVES